MTATGGVDWNGKINLSTLTISGTYGSVGSPTGTFEGYKEDADT